MIHQLNTERKRSAARTTQVSGLARTSMSTIVELALGASSWSRTASTISGPRLVVVSALSLRSDVSVGLSQSFLERRPRRPSRRLEPRGVERAVPKLAGARILVVSPRLPTRDLLHQVGQAV